MFGDICEHFGTFGDVWVINQENKLLHHDWLDIVGRFWMFCNVWGPLGKFGDVSGSWGMFCDIWRCLGMFWDVWNINQFIASLFINKFQLVLRMMQSYQEAMALASLDWPGLGWT